MGRQDRVEDHRCFKEQNMLIAAILSACAAGFLGSWFMSRFGGILGLIDKPNERSSHAFPTPRGGGIGIWFVCAASCFAIFKNYTLTAVLIVLGFISLLEDRYSLQVGLRLGIQCAGAVLSVLVIRGNFQSLTGALIFIFWVFFIVATANYYNFMDGINGIAGVTAFIGFIFLAFFSFYIAHDITAALACIFVAASCLGFLPLNMPAGKVFMGDVGSITLGFFFAVMVVRLTGSFSDFLCLSSFLFPFYADELTTIPVRLKKRENLFKPHRKHLYQILANSYTIKHYKISLGYGFVQIAVGGMMIFVKSYHLLVQVALLCMFFSIFAGVSYCIRNRIEDRGRC